MLTKELENIAALIPEIVTKCKKSHAGKLVLNNTLLLPTTTECLFRYLTKAKQENYYYLLSIINSVLEYVVENNGTGLNTESIFL